MIKQKTINSFFSPLCKKRTLPVRDETNVDPKDHTAEAPLKRAKLKTDVRAHMSESSGGHAVPSGGLQAQGAPDGFGESWRAVLKSEFGKPYFTQLMSFISEERKQHTVYPSSHKVFTWTQLCPIQDVKVVILGQDPYHGPNQAHGLCFSVQKPVPPPPSLVNMYKELASDIEGFQHPGHGDLTGWAKQGVLLLNSVLTVQAHKANSHKDKGWEKFTDAVVQWLSSNLKGLVFMLWGSYAQKKGATIDKKQHYILQTVHPSPLSAHRGFFGCKHFSKANELLKKSGKKPVDWKAL